MFKSKEYVLAVYKHKSFSKAAKEMYISQPSLSASIKRIENEIGSPLFDRSTNPLSLTEVGEKYIESALSISQTEDNFKNFVADHLNMLTGDVKIGGSSMFSSFVLPTLISKFNKDYPKIDFDIIEDNTQNLIDLLIGGDLDMMIDNVLITNKSIKSYVFTTETLLLAVPKSFAINNALTSKQLTAQDIKADRHKMPDAPKVALEIFREEPFIFLKNENDTGKKAVRLCRKHNFTPNILFKLDQQMTAYNITSSGVGISFISDTLIKPLTASPEICYYKLDDEEALRNVYLYIKANKYLSKTCQSFIDMCLKK